MFPHLPRSLARLAATTVATAALVGAPALTSSASAEPVNHAPVAGDVDLSSSANSDFYVPLPGIDKDGDAVSFSILTNPLHGTVHDLYSGPVTWGETPVTYTPAAGFTGHDAFTFAVTDSHGATDVGRVDLTVIPDSPAPVTGTFWIGRVPGSPMSRTFTSDLHLTAGDQVTARHWEFGDSGTADGAKVAHRFPSAGTWNVKLTVKTASGTTFVVVRPVHIS